MPVEPETRARIFVAQLPYIYRQTAVSLSQGTSLRIAKPLLLVSTPIGVVWGVVEAYRFHPWLAVLMTLLLGVISAFIWYTVRVIRREQSRESIDNQSKQKP